MIKIMLVLLLALTTQVHAEGFITCGGIEDGSAIQASLDAGGRTELKGVCVSADQIIIRQPEGLGNQQGDTVLEGGVLRNPGIVIDGVRRAVIRGTEIYSSGVGILVKNAIQVEFSGIYVTSAGDGIVLESIAAVWITGKSQISGQSTNTVGIRIGESPYGFEAVDIDGTLIEGHYTGIRMGGTGNLVNVWIRGVKIDRPFTFGILINPSATASARNIRISDFWINGAPYPLAVNGTETTGSVDRLDITNGHILGATYGPVTIWKSRENVDYRQSGVITGPLEPG